GACGCWRGRAIGFWWERGARSRRLLLRRRRRRGGNRGRADGGRRRSSRNARRRPSGRGPRRRRREGLRTDVGLGKRGGGSSPFAGSKSRPWRPGVLGDFGHDPRGKLPAARRRVQDGIDRGETRRAGKTPENRGDRAAIVPRRGSRLAEPAGATA